MSITKAILAFLLISSITLVGYLMIIPLQFFFEEISRETFGWIELSYEIITSILILNFLLKKEKKFFESKASSEQIS